MISIARVRPQCDTGRSLAEALARLAPPAAAPNEAEAEVRRQALEVVYQALQKIARRMVADSFLAEDIACEVTICLVEAGPRDKCSLPPTDSQAKAYLSVAVRNHQITHWRKGKNHVSLEDAPEPMALADYSQQENDSATVDELLAKARTLLYERAVPEIAANVHGRWNRAGFEVALLDLHDLYHRRTTVEAILIRREGHFSTDGRNRLYKQHQRARTRLLAELPLWLERAQLRDPLETAIRNVASVELAPRSDRGVSQ